MATHSDAAPSLKGHARALLLNEDEGLPGRRQSGRRAVCQCVGGVQQRLDLLRSRKWWCEVGLGLGGSVGRWCTVLYGFDWFGQPQGAGSGRVHFRFGRGAVLSEHLGSAYV
jgi:hypothetical protein